MSVCVECVFRESLRGRIHVASEREREEYTASVVTASVYACVYACVYVLLQQAFMCSCISRAPCATIVPHGSHVGREGGREGRREGDCIDQHACASLAFSVVQFEYENKHLLQLSVCLMRPSCVICSVLFCRVSAVCLPCHFPVCPFCLSPPVSLTLFLSLSFSRSLARARSPARRAPCFACKSPLLCLHHHADTNCQSHQTLKARISRTLYRFMHLAPCPPPPPARLPCSTAASCLTRPHLCPPLPKRPAPEPLEKQSLEKVSYPVSNAKCSLMPHALSCHMLPLSVCLPISCN